MSHAIPVFAAIFLCLTAAGLVGRQLFAAPRPRNRLSRLDWQVWRAVAWLHLRVYAWRWTALRWHLMLRARFAAEVASPDGLPLIPASGAARFRPGSAGLPNLDHVLPALSAKLDAARTRDDLTVIHAGGMLLPDRPRTTCEPGPFRIPPYYEAWEQGRWVP